jgi:uncharacterized protein involved in type VI secretion and phage assembly
MNKIMTGFVSDNQDPDQNGRVKVNVYLSMVPFETDWLPMISLFAGEERGAFSLPDVGDFVVIAFQDNSYRKGYVLGSVWTQNTALPLSEENSDADLNADGKNAQTMFRSRSGQRIILDDTDGAEKIQVLNPDGTSRIELNTEEEAINLISEVDVTLSSETMVGITAEEIQMETEGDLTGECENFGVEASGDTTLAGDGGVVLEGKGVGLN